MSVLQLWEGSFVTGSKGRVGGAVGGSESGLVGQWEEHKWTDIWVAGEPSAAPIRHHGYHTDAGHDEKHYGDPLHELEVEVDADAVFWEFGVGDIEGIFLACAILGYSVDCVEFPVLHGFVDIGGSDIIIQSI